MRLPWLLPEASVATTQPLMMINSENAEGSLCYPLESPQDLNFSSYITNYSTNSKINLNSTVSFVKEYCKNILKKLLSHNSFSTSNTAQIAAQQMFTGIEFNIRSPGQINTTILCVLNNFNFLWLIQDHYPPLSSHIEGQTPLTPVATPRGGPNLPKVKFTT